MKRIDALIESINGYDTVIDIGCDHGFVLKGALDKGYIVQGIAVEVNEKPLQNAINNLTGYNVKFCLSNGFDKVNEHYDAVVLAGMGFHLIQEIILKEKINPLAEFIIASQNKIMPLRQWLFDNNFMIIDEMLAYEELFYPIIKVKRGKPNFNESDFLVGPLLKTKKSSLPYYQYLLAHYQTLVVKQPQPLQQETQKLIKTLNLAIKSLSKNN